MSHSSQKGTDKDELTDGNDRTEADSPAEDGEASEEQAPRSSDEASAFSAPDTEIPAGESSDATETAENESESMKPGTENGGWNRYLENPENQAAPGRDDEGETSPAAGGESIWDLYISEVKLEPKPVNDREGKTPPLDGLIVLDDEEAETIDESDAVDDEVSLPFDPETIIAPIADRLAELDRKVSRLDNEFQGKLKYDAHKNKIIDELHQELQDYKNDIVRKHLQSLILDVIKIIDNIRRLTSHYMSQNPEETDPKKLLELLENIPSDLEDIFYWQGVRPFTCDGNEFNPKRQRVLKKFNTEDKSKDKTVAESLRPGYEWGDKLIRPEMVAVFVYGDQST